MTPETVPAAPPVIQPVRTDAEKAMNELAGRICQGAYMVEQDVGQSQIRTILRRDEGRRHRLSIVQDKKADGYFQTVLVSYGYSEDPAGPETYCETIALNKTGGLGYTLVTGTGDTSKTIKTNAPGDKLEKTAFTRRVKRKGFWASLTGSEITCVKGSFDEAHVHNIARALDGKQTQDLFAENIDAEEVVDAFYGPMPLLS